MEFQCLKYVKKDAICYLTLNRPEKLNALNAVMMSEFREALDVIEADPDIRVAILTGAGRAFSAGFDLEREPGAADPHGMQADEWRNLLISYIDTFMMVWNLSKPVIRRRKRVRPGRSLRIGSGLRHKNRLRPGNYGRTGDSLRTGPTVSDYPLQRQPGRGQGVAVDRRYRGC